MLAYFAFAKGKIRGNGTAPPRGGLRFAGSGQRVSKPQKRRQPQRDRRGCREPCLSSCSFFAALSWRWSRLQVPFRRICKIVTTLLLIEGPPVAERLHFLDRWPLDTIQGPLPDSFLFQSLQSSSLQDYIEKELFLDCFAC